jgi:hypothetical protein
MHLAAAPGLHPLDEVVQFGGVVHGSDPGQVEPGFGGGLLHQFGDVGNHFPIIANPTASGLLYS